MSLSKYAVLIWAFLLGTAAVAGDHQHTNIAIALDGDEQSLAPGESRVCADETGNVVKVMRERNGRSASFVRN